MEDSRIVEMYWERNEAAISQTQEKYGNYLSKIAYNILADIEDSKESVNDTYLRAWNSIPPHKPVRLSAFLAKITRQISIDIYSKKAAKKRVGS
jgi:RNA polymerase sigma-70 factor (ECF subfamily)